MDKLRAILPYFIAGILCICISIPAFCQSIYIDEAYSIEFARGSISSVIENSSLDDHPPLYYLIVKLAEILGGESITKYRFVSLLPAYLNLIIIGATYVRKRFSSTTSFFYILWFGAAYSTFERSVAIRMYSWACFFVTAACISLFTYYETDKTSPKKKKSFLISILFTLAAMYTHYYALLAMLIAWAILLLATFLQEKKAVRNVLGGGLIITVAYLPWLIKFLTRPEVERIGDWTKPLEWGKWFLTPSELLESSMTGIGLIFYVLVLGLIVVAFVRKNWVPLLSLSIFAGTMILGAVISVLVFPLWVSRFMYILWGMLSLFVAMVAGEKRDQSLCVPQLLLTGLLLLEMVFSIQTMMQTERMICGADEWVAFTGENISDGACVIVDDPEEHVRIYRVYMPDADFTMTSQLYGENAGEVLLSALSQAPEEQCWFIMDYTQGAFGVERMRSLLNSLGYEMHSAGNYSIEYKNMEIFQIGRNH